MATGVDRIVQNLGGSPEKNKTGVDKILEILENGGGGGSSLPSYDSGDAGKVLTVADDGSLEWSFKQGGGGDFATATLSISSTLTDVEFECIWADDEEGLIPNIYLPDGNGDVTVVLYKGRATLNNYNEYAMSISGNIAYDSALASYVITGDCAVTVS